MIFTELVLQNFGPYKGRQVINLKPNQGPIILFGGMNGGGKTTFMDAIRLALYGHRGQISTRGALSYKNFLAECVNRHTAPGEKTRIELAIELVMEGELTTECELTVLRVVRHWEKGDEQDTLGVQVGDWPDKAIANTWDEYIEKLFPLGISTLFLFDGEQVKELAEVDTPPPVLVGAIKSLLGLEVAQQLSVDLDVLASRKRKALAKNSKEVAEFDELEKTIQTQRQARDRATQELASIDGRLKSAEKQQQQALDKFVVEGGRIAGDRSRLEIEGDRLAQEAAESRQELRDLAAGSLPLMMIAPLLASAQAQIQAEKHITQSKAAQDLIRERDQDLLDYLFKMPLEPMQVNQVQAFLTSKSFAVEGDEWLLADVDAARQLDVLLEYELAAQANTAINGARELKRLQTEIDFLDRELARAASPEDYEKLQQAVETTQKTVAQLIAQRELQQRQYNEVERTLNASKNELESYAEEHFKYQEIEHTISSIARAKETLKIFQEKITLQKINKLEMEVTKCFCYLLRKTELIHRVCIDPGTFGMNLFDDAGVSVPKHRLSAGEKQLLAISFLWGLARISKRKIPVAIDTPLGRLDSSHRANLIERYFPVASNQVILLSTDTEIGESERQQLKKMDAISHEYLLKYNPAQRFTSVIAGYFFQ